MDDRELLRRYSQAHDEEAFTQLVNRYLGMVFGTAMRRAGHREIAEEITQNVFALLARKATQLTPGTVIAGWLHRTTVLQSSHAMRSERTRKHKMKAFSESLSEDLAEHEAEWKDVVHLLDESMNQLPRNDRDVLFLRFFEGWTLRDIGQRLGKSESATQRHTTRALEKLSRVLRKKGVTISASALAAGLVPELAQAAPAGLSAAVISKTALSTGSVTASTGILTHLFITMTHTKTSTLILAGCGLIALCTGSGLLIGKLRHPVEADQTPATTNGESPSGSPNRFASSGLRPTDPAANDPGNPVIAILQKAVAILNKTSSPKSVEEDVRAIVAKLSRENMDEALSFAARTTLEKEAGDLLREEIYRCWGKLDGPEALTHALAIAEDEERDDAVRKVINGWAESDPAAAYAWYEKIREAEDRPISERATAELIKGIGKGWIRHDLEGGFAMIEALPYDAQMHVVHEFGDFANVPDLHDTVARKISELPDSNMRAQMISRFGKKWAREAPREMAQWFDGIDYDSPASRFQSSNALGEAYFQSHPREAVDWFYAKVPEAVKQDFIRGVVAGEWAERDPAAARSWLTEHGFNPDEMIK
ncbi:MAG: sigma-70 family RNA polymerase sigma factor [Verrucomicrobiota bacterium]